MRAVIDEIIDQFHSGRPGRKCASMLYKKTFLLVMEPSEASYRGNVIPKELLAFDSYRPRGFENALSKDRLNELTNGAEPSDEERRIHRESMLRGVEEFREDVEMYPAYFIRRLQHADGREVFVLATARSYHSDPLEFGFVPYSDLDLEFTFEGLFATVEDALSNLSRWGLVVPCEPVEEESGRVSDRGSSGRTRARIRDAHKKLWAKFRKRQQAAKGEAEQST